MTNQLGDLLIDQLDQRRQDVGGRIKRAAEALRQVGQGFENDGLGGPGTGLLNRGADLVERAGSYVEESDFNVLISDAEDFARRQPWTVAAVGVTLGLLASRLLKSTAARRSANGPG